MRIYSEALQKGAWIQPRECPINRSDGGRFLLKDREKFLMNSTDGNNLIREL